METFEKKQAPLSAESAEPKKCSKAGGRGKRIAAILVVAAVLAAVVLKSCGSGPTAAAVVYTQEQPAYRTIVQTVSDSGMVQPADSYTVTSLVSGEILSDTFEEGDLVAKGDLLYTIDSSDAATSVTSSDLNYQQALKAKYPAASISGVISEVYVKNGDTVNNGTALCKIVGSSDLNIDFYFHDTNAAEFYVGQMAEVYISSFADVLYGTVTAVSETYSAEGTGMKLRTVRVSVANPGLVTEDCTAQASIGGYANYGAAVISLADTVTVHASGSGTVQNFTKLSGDRIQAGDRLCIISSDSIDNQITNAQLNLDSSRDRLENYTITAPISGTVITKTGKAGDKLNGTGSSLAVIYDLSYLQVELAIDELDISKVSVGQSVTITADAVGGVLSGYVDKVSIAGTSNGGVTTYPVTVIVEVYGALLPGMNVDAEIILVESRDALSVNSAAVNRGNTVMITADSPSAVNALEQAAPEGYVYVRVETGVSDDDYIQILSGLQEGDVIAYEKADHSSGDLMSMMMQQREEMMSGGGMPGEMQGGMPGGGMQGGMPTGGGPRG